MNCFHKLSRRVYGDKLKTAYRSNFHRLSRIILRVLMLVVNLKQANPNRLLVLQLFFLGGIILY